LLDKEFKPKLSPEISSALEQVLAVIDLTADGSVGRSGESACSASDFGEMDLDEEHLDFFAEQCVGPPPDDADKHAEYDAQIKKAKAAFRTNKGSITKKLNSIIKTKTKVKV
jgi:hypothetical protein